MNSHTSELWPLAFGDCIPFATLAALQEDASSWLSKACRRKQVSLIVAPSSDALLNRADFPPNSPADATVAILQPKDTKSIVSHEYASKKLALCHLFLRSEDECIYWGAYNHVPNSNNHYIYLAVNSGIKPGPDPALNWSSLGIFEDLPLDAPEPTLIAFFSDDRDAATVEHRRLQNLLAAWLRQSNLQPRDFRSNRHYVDIAWELPAQQRFVCEVKTVSSANERMQIFSGMGQVQTYSLTFDARPVLFLGTRPTQLERIFSPIQHGIIVLWPDALDAIRPKDLDGVTPSAVLQAVL